MTLVIYICASQNSWGKKRVTHESKHTPFHDNIMCITPDSTENPPQSSRVVKFSSAVLHSVKGSKRKGPHLATFQWLRFYYSVYYHIFYWILRYLLHGAESFVGS